MKTIEQTINITDANNANIGGFYGKLSSYGIKGSSLNLKNITVYRRNGSITESGDVRCKVLYKLNNEWHLASKSTNTTNINNYSAGDGMVFNMEMAENAPYLTSNDIVAIIFSNNDSASVTHSVNMSLKTMPNINGGISVSSGSAEVELPINPNLLGFVPAISFDYYSYSVDDSVLHSDRDEDVNGVKTFNNRINAKGEIVITDSDGDKSVIRTSIDSGELKVTKPDSSYGFVVRTSNSNNNKQDDKYRLELLTTNGSSSYQYNFPYKSGTVALKEVADNGGLEYDGEALKIVLEPDSGLKINEQGQLTLDYDVIKTKLGLA